MKLMSGFLLLCIFTIVIKAHISINIDPEDLDRISDFFQQIIHIHYDNLYETVPSVATRNNIITKMGKYVLKGLIETVRVISIIVALVGSNLISMYIMPDSVPVQSKIQPNLQTPINIIDHQLNPAVHAEKCQTDYGCSNNVCWRSCHSNTETPLLWCYTNPKPNVLEYYHCETTEDCFLCWECIEPCHQ